MKYGLVYFKDTDNIGDDIQTYAASRFLPKIDYLIDRDDMELFVPEKQEYVAAILNGWYTHSRFNFAFSQYIYPLLISMFFKDYKYKAGTTIGHDYLLGYNKEYLNFYGPVGVRDYHTKNLLDDFGISNYFSGCMTLTLDRFPDVPKKEYICVSGLDVEEVTYIKNQTNREIIEIDHIIEKGSLSNLNWEERKNKVIEILKIYQSAHFVVTNKLHVSLPCLALGTPVLLILNDRDFKEDAERFGSYLDKVNYVKKDEFKSVKINFEKPNSNPSAYLEIRKNLIEKCTKFINDVKKIDPTTLPKLMEIEIAKKFINNQRQRTDLILKYFDESGKLYEEECLKSSELSEKIVKLESNNERQQKTITKLNNENENLKLLISEKEQKLMEIEQEVQNILNSISWKVTKPMRTLMSKIRK